MAGGTALTTAARRSIGGVVVHPPLLADTRGRVGPAAALGPEGGRLATLLERTVAPARPVWGGVGALGAGWLAL